MRQLAIKQFSPADGAMCVHMVTVPDFRDPGFYRSTMSYSAFFHGHRNDRNNFWALHPRTAKANGFKSKKPTHKFWYHMIPREEWEDNIKREFYKLDKALPIVEHASIWDFYKHIGFDYKTGKWSKNLITKELKSAKMPY
jgi:hypothetical protein